HCGPLGLLHPTGAPLLPKLRGHFAEFLNESSSARLRMLCSPTCVGLRYGRLRLARGFSRQPEYTFFEYYHFLSPSQPSLHGVRICLYTSLTAWTDTSISPQRCPSASPHCS